MFTPAQKAKLKAVGRLPNHPLFGHPNPALDKAIDEIYLQNPNAFLEEGDFGSRIFYHRPRDNPNPKYQIKYAGYWEEFIPKSYGI